MVIEVDRLARDIVPERTVIFFGAGSSIPSGSPSAAALSGAIASRFDIPAEGYTLAETAELAELNRDRRALIECVREEFPQPSPTGGLTNLALYEWKSIFTTNYDELIERCYSQKSRDLVTYTTNFDFSKPVRPNSQFLFKMHGTLNEDIIDGSKSRMILTVSDYDKAEEYRDFLFDRLRSDISGSDLLIVGYSLSDPDIKSIVDRALSLQAKTGVGGSVYLFLYERDDNRARLFEARGVKVCFGGIDQLFDALGRTSPTAQLTFTSSLNPLDAHPTLRATTVDAKHSISSLQPNASAMFNGWPASYADIAGSLTFARTASNAIFGEFTSGDLPIACILGASGTGKTTAARQVVVRCEEQGWWAWEHKRDFPLAVNDWVAVAKKLAFDKSQGVLLVDEAHEQVSKLNELSDALAISSLDSLRLIIVSSRSSWQFRVKSPSLTRRSKEYLFSKMNDTEIDRLLLLVDASPAIRPLVEATFGGFSRQEKRRRLVEKCEADTFVCMKNIFATSKFDDIILREFADLESRDQEIYRLVAAMEHFGIRVHRQLVVRLAGISANKITDVLDSLIDLIHEYDVSEKQGVYGWKVRHSVIAGIIAKYKFAEQDDKLRLFENVIDNISPTYDIERRTINEICNIDTGLPSIGDKGVQNRLLRRIISIAPGERVPRHRLIRNLISLEQFDLAETEIRVFRNDLGGDGPVSRYQVSLLIARAAEKTGLLQEDRIVILRQAESLARVAVERYSNNRSVHAAFCDVGLEFIKVSANFDIYDKAIAQLKALEAKTGDEEVTKLIRFYERRVFELMGVPAGAA